MEDDQIDKKLSHRQKQRAARRLKKKQELVEKRKALKQKKKQNHPDKSVIENGKDSDNDENIKGMFHSITILNPIIINLLYIH